MDVVDGFLYLCGIEAADATDWGSGLCSSYFSDQCGVFVLGVIGETGRREGTLRRFASKKPAEAP